MVAIPVPTFGGCDARMDVAGEPFTDPEYDFIIHAVAL